MKSMTDNNSTHDKALRMALQREQGRMKLPDGMSERIMAVVREQAKAPNASPEEKKHSFIVRWWPVAVAAAVLAVGLILLPRLTERRELARYEGSFVEVEGQRLDNLHKLSTGIANRYDVVCVESLNMKAMSNKGFGNGKATMDNGYGLFLSMLEYKLADRNKYLMKVDKWFSSSQLCHCCGTLHPEMKDLSIRTMKCDCGLTISRDQNAAINILNEGLRMLGTA